MDFPFYLIFAPLLMLLLNDSENHTMAKIVLTKRNNNKEDKKMIEQLSKLVGKECFIYTIQSNNSVIKGILIEVEEKCIVLKTKNTKEIINLEYITRVTEIIKNK